MQKYHHKICDTYFDFDYEIRKKIIEKIKSYA